jgi:ATP-dependent Lon protease
VLAAYRAGLRHLIMPASNEKDLRDVPDEVKKQITFTFVSTMDEVLRLALLPLGSDEGEPEERPSSPSDSSAKLRVSTEPTAVNAT